MEQYCGEERCARTEFETCLFECGLEDATTPTTTPTTTLTSTLAATSNDVTRAASGPSCCDIPDAERELGCSEVVASARQCDTNPNVLRFCPCTCCQLNTTTPPPSQAGRALLGGCTDRCVDAIEPCSSDPGVCSETLADFAAGLLFPCEVAGELRRSEKAERYNRVSLSLLR